jgi:hypothetical protein
MAFCESSDWTMDMYKDAANVLISPSTSLGRLFFELTITGGVISGAVFTLGVKLSDVSGTCRDIPDLNIALMHLNFTWVADVVLVGIVRMEGTFAKFRGRFCAFPHVGFTDQEIKRLALLAVDPGDTGTANGTQT